MDRRNSVKHAEENATCPGERDGVTLPVDGVTDAWDEPG